MAAGTLDFMIEQGATFNLLLTWKINAVPVNLSGYTARLQARVDIEDTETILSLTTGAGITLGGSAGTISLDQSAAQTAVLPNGASKKQRTHCRSRANKSFRQAFGGVFSGMAYQNRCISNVHDYIPNPHLFNERHRFCCQGLPFQATP